MGLAKLGTAVALLLAVTSVSRGASFVTPVMEGPSAGVACHLLLLPSQAQSKAGRVELMSAGALADDPASPVGDSGEQTVVPGGSINIGTSSGPSRAFCQFTVDGPKKAWRGSICTNDQNQSCLTGN
jgi:hypothetical protein